MQIIKKKTMTEYESMIKKGQKDAIKLFPETRYLVNNIKIGNTGINGELDGYRLGKCEKTNDGSNKIYISKTILEQYEPNDNMDQEIRATVVHEYAHVSNTIYAYNKSPLSMYLTILRGNQRSLEKHLIEEFYNKHKNKKFTKYIERKREGEDIPTELISEAYESVYCKDENMDEAQDIVKDYQMSLEQRPKVPIIVFVWLTRIRNIGLSILLIPMVLMETLMCLMYATIAISIFKALMEIISTT